MPDLGTKSTSRRLRCLTFLVELCCALLKDGKENSLLNRVDRLPSVHSSEGSSATFANVDPGAGATLRERQIASSNVPAGHSCAKFATQYLNEMLRGANAIMRVECDALDTADSYAANEHAGKDAVYWVLVLVSDVLKYFARHRWTVPGCEVLPRPECEGEIGVLSLYTRDNPNIEPGVSTCQELGNGSVIKTPSKVLDLAKLVQVVTALPVKRGLGMVDVALKWLEVTQASISLTRDTFVGPLGPKDRCPLQLPLKYSTFVDIRH